MYYLNRLNEALLATVRWYLIDRAIGPAMELYFDCSSCYLFMS
jgi:hypothetical protein